MSREKIKLPRSSYDELIKIIKAYGRVSTNSTLDEIAQISGIGRTNISSNNAFLTSIGIIEGARTKAPTSTGRQLALALEHEMPEKLENAWQAIVEESDFLTKMVQAVDVRKEMEISHLENHIAYSAGESKSKFVMTGARAVVDILLASGFVIREGDQVSSVKTSGKIRVPQDDTGVPKPFIDEKISASVTKLDPTDVKLSIQVNINAGVDELDGLGEKIRALIKEFKTTDPNSGESSTNDK